MTQSLLNKIERHLADEEIVYCDRTEQITVVIQSDALLETCKLLRDESELAFEQLSDLSAVDYSTYGQADWETQSTTKTGFSRAVNKEDSEVESNFHGARYVVVYHLLSITHNHRLRLKCLINSESLTIPSVVSIWPVANWYEREAFDLFGILFDGHPDLRRLLTDYGFIGHPFRKDFPLEGNVEVRYDPEKERVVYQPVTIENRVLVPRVIRHDNRYEKVEE